MPLKRNSLTTCPQVLREWFDKHALDPYPSNDEKIDLAQKANMDVKQVENCALKHSTSCHDEPYTTYRPILPPHIS